MWSDIIWAIGRTHPWFRKLVYILTGYYFWGIICFILDYGKVVTDNVKVRELDEMIAKLFPPTPGKSDDSTQAN